MRTANFPRVSRFCLGFIPFFVVGRHRFDIQELADVGFDIDLDFFFRGLGVVRHLLTSSTCSLVSVVLPFDETILSDFIVIWLLRDASTECLKDTSLSAAAAAAAFRDRKNLERRGSEEFPQKPLLMTEMVFFSPDAVNGCKCMFVPAIRRAARGCRRHLPGPPRHRHRRADFPPDTLTTYDVLASVPSFSSHYFFARRIRKQTLTTARLPRFHGDDQPCEPDRRYTNA